MKQWNEFKVLDDPDETELNAAGAEGFSIKGIGNVNGAALPKIYMERVCFEPDYIKMDTWDGLKKKAVVDAAVRLIKAPINDVPYQERIDSLKKLEEAVNDLEKE